jgi:hypothetical protein
VLAPTTLFWTLHQAELFGMELISQQGWLEV